MEHDSLEPVALDAVPIDKECTLVKWGNLDQKTIDRLEHMGILLGVTLKVIELSVSGPLVVVLNDSRVALGHEVSKELKVIL